MVVVDEVVPESVSIELLVLALPEPETEPDALPDTEPETVVELGVEIVPLAVVVVVSVVLEVADVSLEVARAELEVVSVSLVADVLLFVSTEQPATPRPSRSANDAPMSLCIFMMSLLSFECLPERGCGAVVCLDAGV